MRTSVKARHTFLAMNTVAEITLYGGRAERALAAAEAEAKRLESLFSRFLPTSDIGLLNRAAGMGPVRLHPETFEVLSIARDCSRNTGGCFDCTVGPLVRLWRASALPPDERAIEAARKLTGFEALMLNKRGFTAAFPRTGQSADLGGVGKGYAADRMLAVFRRHGVRSACLDFGGNVALLGAKPGGIPWTVGVRHPGRAGELIGVLEARNESVVTSGDDQRAVTGADGVRRSHILDPRTGLPAESGLLSVTVTAQSSAVADALATALFAAGMREGADFLLRYPGSQAVFIDRDAAVYLTRGLADRFRAAQGVRATVL